MNSTARAARLSAVDVTLRMALVGLTVATAYIHSTLGGLMFLANAAGFATLAAAMIAPIGLAVRFRGLLQVALGGFAAATIFGWALFGARYSTAYIATGIEVAIVAIVAIATNRAYGSPVAIIRSLVARSLVARITAPSNAGAGA